MVKSISYSKWNLILFKFTQQHFSNILCVTSTCAETYWNISLTHPEGVKPETIIFSALKKQSHKEVCR
jgi:hypothetical protein